MAGSGRPTPRVRDRASPRFDLPTIHRGLDLAGARDCVDRGPSARGRRPDQRAQRSYAGRFGPAVRGHRGVDPHPLAAVAPPNVRCATAATTATVATVTSG